MRRLVLVFLAVVVGSFALAQAPAYFVKADMVRAAQGAMGPVCVINSVFFGGEMVVFRAIVYDAATGEELKFDQVLERGITLTVHVDSVDPIVMFYPPPGAAGAEGPPPGAEFFRGTWPIASDFPTGSYGWHIDITDAAGNVGEFQPIGAAIGLSNLTIQPPN